MYAVIFRAEVAKLDPEYSATAERLRTLAINRYGCREFTACTEGGYEIAISYWDSEAQIKDWKQDPEHQAAQAKGHCKWYKFYSVQVVEVLRESGSDL